MSFSEIFPKLLATGIVLTALTGLAALIWGSRLIRKGDWLVSSGLLYLLVILSGGLYRFFDDYQVRSWVRGWVWSAPDAGTLPIGVGIMQDPLGLIMALLAVFLALVFVVNQSVIAKEPRVERLYASAAFGAAGAALAWIACTPWFGFVGLALCSLGSFVALGCRWDTDREASVASRLGAERSLGLFLAISGAFALVSCGALLNWPVAQAWPVNGGPVFGATLLVIGLFLQFHSFPLLGWFVTPSSTAPVAVTAFAQVIPAWAAMSILIRLDSQFRGLGVFPAFGWVAFASAVLAVISAWFQTDWRSTLGLWISAGFLLALSALAFSGPSAGFALTVAFGLGGFVQSLAGSALTAVSEKSAALASRRTFWTKALVFGGLASSGGMIGFLSCSGGIDWITRAGQAPGLNAVFALALFLVSVTGWKVAWTIVKLRSANLTDWISVFSALIVVTLSLSFIWTGTLTGGVLPGDTDLVLSPLINTLIGIKGAHAPEDSARINAEIYYWSGIIAAVVVGNWASAGKRDFWAKAQKALPRTAAFFKSGYYLDVAGFRAWSAVTRVARALELWIDRKFWNHWIPRGISWFVRRFSSLLVRGDRVINTHFESAVRISAEVPSKGLQLIQNGDVQWYLLLAIGFGIAILVHFLRS